MDNLPPVCIFFMTKEMEGREHVAARTMLSLVHYLGYDGVLNLAIADGGSSENYIAELMSIAKPIAQVIDVFSSDGPAGTVWNIGVKKSFVLAPILIRMEDDFELTSPLDVTPYARLLMEKSSVGMVRLGLMPIGLNLHSVAHTDKTGHPEIYFDCLPSTAYAYSGNPCLIHKRFHDDYGMFDETKNPGDIEIDFDNRIRSNMKSRIWYPLALGAYGAYGPWAHIGEVQSY